MTKECEEKKCKRIIADNEKYCEYHKNKLSEDRQNGVGNTIVSTGLITLIYFGIKTIFGKKKK